MQEAIKNSLKQVIINHINYLLQYPFHLELNLAYIKILEEIFMYLYVYYKDNASMGGIFLSNESAAIMAVKRLQKIQADPEIIQAQVALREIQPNMTGIFSIDFQNDARVFRIGFRNPTSNTNNIISFYSHGFKNRIIITDTMRENMNQLLQASESTGSLTRLAMDSNNTL